MKKLLPVILLCLVGTALGQSGVQQKVAAFEKGKEYSVNYDKFKDKTSVYTPRHVVVLPKGVWGAYIKCSAGLVFAGTEPKGDAAYFLWFASTSTDWQFLRSHSLILLADGEKIDLGPGYRSSDIKSGTVSETMGYSVDASQMATIAKAAKVEFQLGNFEGELAPETLLAIKNLASLIK